MTSGSAMEAGAVSGSRRLAGYTVATAAALALVTGLRLLLLAVAPADLYPDEAQYWFWAQTPALGYYSKPPLVAWTIALTTGTLGDSEFAIRFAAPLLHAVSAWFVYLLAARLYDRRVGFWSALAYATLPGVAVSGFLISTDAVLLPCWAAALYFFVRARASGGFWWVAVGGAAGLGLLGKYAMAYWLLSALGLALLARSERRHLRGLLGASLLALLIYAPNFWWNLQNGFVSYRHTRDNAAITGIAVHPERFAEFFLSQFGVFGPLFFAALLVMVVRRRNFADRRERLLAVFIFPTLAMMCGVSLLSRAQPNWAAPAYIAATVLVIGWLLQHRWQRLVAASIALHVAAAAALFGGRDALAATGIVLPGKYDPLHRLRGWRELGERTSAVLAQHPGFGLVADDREVAAALVYYVHPHPFGAAVWDPKRLITNQWDLTNDLAKHLGESFLIVARNDPYWMAESFAGFETLPPIDISLGPGLSRHFSLYLGRGFLGYPKDRAR